VEAAVVNFIYGGMNVIGGTVADFTKIGNVVITAGDFEDLSRALTDLDVPAKEIENLNGAIEADNKGFGQRTEDWVLSAGKSVAKGGAKLGAAVGQEVLKEMVMQYLNLK